jgi:hypothetical protein
MEPIDPPSADPVLVILHNEAAITQAIARRDRESHAVASRRGRDAAHALRRAKADYKATLSPESREALCRAEEALRDAGRLELSARTRKQISAAIAHAITVLVSMADEASRTPEPQE